MRKSLIRFLAYGLIVGGVTLACVTPLFGQTPRSETRVSNVGKVKRLATAESALDLDLKMWRFVPLTPNGTLYISVNHNGAGNHSLTLQAYETVFPNIRFRGNEDRWEHVEESRSIGTTLCITVVANDTLTCSIPTKAAAQVAFFWDFTTLTGTDFDVTVVQTGWPNLRIEGMYARGSVFNVLSKSDQQPNPVIIGAIDPTSGTVFALEGSNSGSNLSRMGTSPVTGITYPQAGTTVSGMPTTGIEGNFALAVVPLMNAARAGFGFQYSIGTHFGGFSVTDECRFHQMSNSVSGGQCYIGAVFELSAGAVINSDLFNLRRNSTVDDKGFIQYIEISSDTAGVHYAIDIIDSDGTICTSVTPNELRDDASFPSAFIASELCTNDPNSFLTNYASIGPIPANTVYRMNFPFSLGGGVTRGITIRNRVAITGAYTINVVWTEVPGTP